MILQTMQQCDIVRSEKPQTDWCVCISGGSMENYFSYFSNIILYDKYTFIWDNFTFASGLQITFTCILQDDFEAFCFVSTWMNSKDSCFFSVCIFFILDVAGHNPNSSDAIWCHETLPTLVHVMACWLTVSSHYLNQRWLIISEVLWPSTMGNFRGIAI